MVIIPNRQKKNHVGKETERKTQITQLLKQSNKLLFFHSVSARLILFFFAPAGVIEWTMKRVPGLFVVPLVSHRKRGRKCVSFAHGSLP